ncbi:MAG: hypothetical protein AAGB04_15475 [Pseudomonadota bacterium]
MVSSFGWQSVVGSSSFGDWLTVALYLGAALLCYFAAGLSRHSGSGRAETFLWQVLIFGLLLLGINKQLDVQSALAEIGRSFAHQQGWYEVRRPIQFVFILAALISVLGLAAYVLVLTTEMTRPTRFAVFAALFLLAFVVVRAASFHWVDQLIGTRILGLYWNWILEMGGLIAIQAAALWRLNFVPLSSVDVNRR